MVDTSSLLEQCASQVAPRLMEALVRVESAWRPLAIGMDAGQGPVLQPATLTQAVDQAKTLSSAGRGFSVGLAQIHASNVARQGMTWEQAFDPCMNLRAGQVILRYFYRQAQLTGYSGPGAIWAALRGYNTGAIDRRSGDRYARRVLERAQAPLHPPHLTDGPAERSAEPGAKAVTAKSPHQAASGLDGAPTEPVSVEAKDIFSKGSTLRGF